MKTYNVKIKNSFAKLPVNEKITKARYIVDNLNANPGMFQNPSPATNVLSAAANGLELAWQAAEGGDKVKVKMMQHLADELSNLVYDLSNYVWKVAKGDEKIIHAAGFEVRRKPQKSIQDFSAVHEQGGVIRLRVKARSRPKTVYRWELCKHSPKDGPWETLKSTSRCTTRVHGLEPGVRYWFRVFYLGGEEDLQAFEPVSIIAI